MAYMALDVFYEVIVPLMEMRQCVLIGISTPVDTFNFFYTMLELRHPDTGEYIFNRYTSYNSPILEQIHTYTIKN
jgi:hypothetical protein